MSLRDRIGIEWAAKNQVRFIDIRLDTAANAVTTFDDMLAGREFELARAQPAGVVV